MKTPANTAPIDDDNLLAPFAAVVIVGGVPVGEEEIVFVIWVVS